MSEMVERVARAICAKHYADRFKKTETDAHVMANVDANWVDYEPAARAAIEEMSNIDERAFAIAMHEIDDVRGPTREGKQVFREFYQVLIKAALKD